MNNGLLLASYRRMNRLRLPRFPARVIFARSFFVLTALLIMAAPRAGVGADPKRPKPGAPSAPIPLDPPKNLDKALVASVAWKEVPSNTLRIDGVDLIEGAIYFRCEGRRLYYEPQSEDKAKRVAAVTGVMAELRASSSVSLGWSTLEKPPGTRLMPKLGGASPAAPEGPYSPVVSFFVR